MLVTSVKDFPLLAAAVRVHVSLKNKRQHLSIGTVTER